MKKSLFALFFVCTASTVFSQTKQDVTSFVSERVLSFNQGVKIVEVNNIDSIIRTLRKKDVSYSYDSYIFYGSDISSETNMGGSSRTVINSKKVPFVFYKKYQTKGNTIIEVVCGTDCL